MSKTLSLLSAFSAPLRFNQYLPFFPPFLSVSVVQPAFAFLSAFPLCLCGSLLRLPLGDLGALAVQLAFAFLSAFPLAISAPISLTTAAMAHPDDAADTRQPIAALSGISLASTQPTVSIQRQPPLHPPVIAAAKCRNMQNKKTTP